jgi:uncharacterized C2H2 Zn-finger protein
MSYVCERCDQHFTSAKRLENHIQDNTIPCDYFCNKCGIKIKNRTSYSRHIKEECEIKQKTKVMVQKSNIETRVEIDNDENNKNIVVNLEVIRQTGVYGVELEQDELMKYHFSTIQHIFMNHLINTHAEDHENFMLLKTIIKLIYNNEHTPEFINIIDDGTIFDKNKIHNGYEFIVDLMPKNIRNQRVLQLLIKQFENFISIPNTNLSIAEFIKTNFIPYIKKVYVKEEFVKEIQQCWVSNNRIRNIIHYNQLPKFDCNQIGVTNLSGQFNDFIVMQKRIYNDVMQNDEKKYKIILKKNLNKMIVY